MTKSIETKFLTTLSADELIEFGAKKIGETKCFRLELGSEAGIYELSNKNENREYILKDILSCIKNEKIDTIRKLELLGYNNKGSFYTRTDLMLNDEHTTCRENGHELNFFNYNNGSLVKWCEKDKIYWLLQKNSENKITKQENHY